VFVALGLAAVLVGVFVIVRPPVRAPSGGAGAEVRYPAPIISGDALPPFSPPPSGPPIAKDGLRIKVSEPRIDLPVIEGDGVNAPLYKAAHDPRTMWPGQGGRAMVYAHARPGMFGDLYQVKVGQQVEIYRYDKVMVRYVVTEVHARWPSTNLKWLEPVNHEELVLLTCTTYDPNDPRVVVVARPVRS
jgi:LPXTG-site transpeptidase (sortase) family protein